MDEQKLQQTALANLEKSKEPIEKLRNFCLSKGYSGVISLSKVFRRMDKDRSFTLSKDELARGMTQFGLKFSDGDIDSLFKAFEKDGKDGIDYEEFLEAIIPESNDKRKDIIDKAFKTLDKSGDGLVTMDELKARYNVKNHPRVQSGEITEDELIKKFISIFESGGTVDGKVSQKEFHEYYRSLSRSIEDDEYFISIIKKSWNME